MTPGDGAYSPFSALAMTMQYLGLNIETEDYAAAAGIRYGSFGNTEIRRVYEAAAGEARMRMTRLSKFDFERAMRSIDAGLPVLVWRRWTQERDDIHTMFARQFARDPTLELPAPTRAEKETWPLSKV